MTFYPSSSDYDTAIQNADKLFTEIELKKIIPEKIKAGLVCYSGTFATVYKVTINNKIYALRCFTVYNKLNFERYKIISRFVKKNPLYFVDFEYYADAVLVNGKKYPVLKMEWVEGVVIQKYIENNLNNKKKLADINDSLVNLFLWLKSEKVAHGDLSNLNIMVNKYGNLKLIDYDGMYLNEISNYDSGEAGTPEFNHPEGRDYAVDMDNFSMWVIYCSLLVLIHDKSFFHLSSDLIVFDSSDFENPSSSETIERLKKTNKKELLSIANFIEQISRQPSKKVPEFCIENINKHLNVKNLKTNNPKSDVSLADWLNDNPEPEIKNNVSLMDWFNTNNLKNVKKKIVRFLKYLAIFFVLLIISFFIFVNFNKLHELIPFIPKKTLDEPKKYTYQFPESCNDIKVVKAYGLNLRSIQDIEIIESSVIKGDIVCVSGEVRRNHIDFTDKWYIADYADGHQSLIAKKHTLGINAFSAINSNVILYKQHSVESNPIGKISTEAMLLKINEYPEGSARWYEVAYYDKNMNKKAVGWVRKNSVEQNKMFNFLIKITNEINKEQ